MYNLWSLIIQEDVDASDRSTMAHSPAHQRSQSLALLPSQAQGSVARKVPKRTSRDGPGSPRQTALPGTWRVRLEQWFRSFALPLNVFSQKCNTALYSFVFTKNTALNANHPSSSLSLSNIAWQEDPSRRVVCSVCTVPWWGVHSLFHSHGRGPVNGLHHGCKPTAEVIGGVGPDLRGLFQNNDLSGAVEEPGQ